LNRRRAAVGAPQIEIEEEQREIASLLHTIDRKIDVHERKRSTLQERFKGLLHGLMAGEINAANLDIDTSDTVVY
jgi:type I restriction enzyme S subunit